MAPQAPGRFTRQPQPQMPQAPGRRPPRLPAPVKREVSESASRSSRLRVYTEAEQDDIGISTLLGEYTEQGVNHGYPTYQKVLENSDEVNVFVYFWDSRDGPEFSGWWFGDSVGGQQVWSRSVEKSEAADKAKVPPSRGWRVPWDAECVEGLLIVEVMDAMVQPVTNGPTPTAPTAPPPSKANKPQGPAPVPIITPQLIKPKIQPTDSDQSVMLERIKLASDRVAAAEAEVEQAIASTRRTLAAQELEESSLADADTALRSQLENVQNEQKQLAKELSEARAANCSQSNLGELARMMPRLRQSLVKVEAELAKVKNNLAKVRADAVLAKQRVEAVEAAAEAEQRDARAFQAALPEAMEIVTQAEDAVETVAILAAAMSVDDETDTSEAHQVQAIQDIETSATKASADLLEARKLVSNRLGETKRFAPEAKRVAMQEFQAMEKRLAEAAKRLNPLKRFRQEFEQKAAAKKALQEIQNKLNSAELEIEKAHIMTSSTDTQMEQDDITSTTQLLGPAEEDLKKTSQLIDQRQPGQSDAASQKELEGMKKRVVEAREKLQSIRQVLKRQEETLQVDSTLSQVHEKIEQAEEAFLATSEAEMPFLKGLEVLPLDEGAQAVAQCEAATKKCEAALESARTFIKKVESDSKAKYSKEAQQHLMDELQKCRSRGEETEKKLNVFRKETRQRKAKGMLQEVSEKVVEAENQSQALAEVVKVLNTENLDSVTVESLKTAFEQSVAAEKEAVRSYNQARQIITAKQKEVKEPPVLTELTRLQKKLAAAHQEMIKSRQLAKGGDQLIKGKKIFNEEEKKVVAMEQAVERVEKQMPAEDQEYSKEDLINIDSQIKAAVTAVNTSTRTLEAAMTGASVALKTSLTSLMTKVKDASSRVEKAKQASKTQREKAAAEVFVKEAEQQVENVEAALVKVAEAELPFLKGIEVLPLSEASIAIAECEKAAKHVQEALEKAKSFVSAKVMEVQRFAEAAAKPCLERLNGLVERNNAAATKLTEFRKDTESHKRTSQMQEAEEMLNAAEAEIEKTREAGAPLSAEDLSSITQEIGTEICEKIAALEKGASKKVSDALNFLAERRKDVRGTPQEKELEQFQARLGKIKASLAEAKKTASQQEQRFVSRKLQAEGLELVNEVEREVKKVEVAAEPLLASSSFLVRGNLHRLSGLVQDHISKGSSKDSVFQQACGERERVTLEGFQAFVTWILEQSGEDSRDVFLEQEVEAMFTHLDSDKSGDLTEKKFQDIFLDQFACVQPVSMTESFSISEGKSVLKLDLGVAVEALSRPQYDEQQKLTRLHCRLLEDSTKEGWVTMKGNQGKVFLDRLSPHSAHQKSLDRMMSASTKVVNKASSFLSARRKELNDCSNGPLLEAKVKMEEFKVKASSLQRKLDEIKKKVAEAAKEYEKCEAQQKRARSDARDKRLLDAMTKAIEQELHTLKAEEKRIAEVVAPLTNGADLEVLDAPVSILKDGKEMAEKLKEQSAAARKSIQQHEVPQGVAAGTATSMRQVISTSLSEVDTVIKTVNALVKAVNSSAVKVAEAIQRRVQLALRQEVQRRDIRIEVIFDEISNGGHTASRSDLSRCLNNLPDLKLTTEQISLMLDRIIGDNSEDGVISRWNFLRRFQQFYECQKTIALTHDLAITNSKPIRMLNAEEAIEVLEGPRGDEKSGIERIRGRAVRDNTIGWVSVSGNQGSVFLKERPKPFVHCLVDLPLEKSFRSSGEAPVRSLKTNEVLEILEGPRQDSRDAVMRVRCKVFTDQLEGWVTLNSAGEMQAQTGQQRFWKCKTGVAVTDGPNIKLCKVLRKMEVGELIRLLEGPEVDKESGVTRIKALCLKDGLEGWVTTLGNAGTLYAEEKSDIYSVSCDELPLQKAYGDLSSGTIRMLRKDEAFEVLEGPKEFRPEPVERMKGRALADGAVGWVTATTKRLKRWYPNYICKQNTVLQTTVSIGPTAGLVRRVEEGELLEVLDGPKEDSEAGVLRVKVKTRKDQAVGWITLKGNQGTLFLIQWSRRDEEQLKQKQKSLQEGLGAAKEKE